MSPAKKAVRRSASTSRARRAAVPGSRRQWERDPHDPDFLVLRAGRHSAPLATALQHGHIIYLVGSLFVAIAFQPFIYMMLSLEIGLTTYCRRREQQSGWRPLMARPAQVPARHAFPAER